MLPNQGYVQLKQPPGRVSNSLKPLLKRSLTQDTGDQSRKKQSTSQTIGKIMMEMEKTLEEKIMPKRSAVKQPLKPSLPALPVKGAGSPKLPLQTSFKIRSTKPNILSTRQKNLPPMDKPACVTVQTPPATPRISNSQGQLKNLFENGSVVNVNKFLRNKENSITPEKSIHLSQIDASTLSLIQNANFVPAVNPHLVHNTQPSIILNEDLPSLVVVPPEESFANENHSIGNADQTLMSDGEFAEEDLLENGTQVPSPTSENFSDPDNTQYEHEESIHDNYIDPAGEHVEEQLDNRSNTIASALATNQEIEPQANNDILHNEELVHNQHNCCDACRIQNIQAMNKLNRMETKLDLLLGHLHVQDVAAIPNYDLLPVFPLQTQDDLENFEGDLMIDEQMQQQFRHKISKIGGETMPKFARGIMARILTDELTLNLTWCQNKDNKIAISESTLITIVIFAVLGKYPDSSEAEIRKVLQSWVQKPSDRINNKLRKGSKNNLQRRQQLLPPQQPQAQQHLPPQQQPQQQQRQPGLRESQQQQLQQQSV